MKRKQLIRESFRTAVLGRDGNQCVFCDETQDLDAHHISDRSKMPNGGYVKENGITLCPDHHLDAELYHISNGNDFVKGLHPNDLYAIISSSYKLAVEKSRRL